MISRSEPGDVTVYPIGRNVWVVCSDPERGYAVQYRLRLTPTEALWMAYGLVMSAFRVWLGYG